MAEVYAIAPGLFEAAFAASITQIPSVHQAVVRQTPLGRHGQPDDLVGAAIFRALRAADSMTDRVLAVDGGVRM